MPQKFYLELADGVWLHNRYVVEKLSAKKIAAIIGCNTSSVRAALMRHSILRRPSGVNGTDPRLKDREWLAEQMAERTGVEIAKETGACTASVYRACHRLKIPVPRGHRPT